MTAVVREMGVLDHSSNISGNTLKIPDYAKDYKNEYLFIRGIDKTCGDFLKNLYKEEIFKSPKAVNLIRYINRFLKAQQLGYLNDISEIYFKEDDVGFIESLELQLDDYRNFYYDMDSYEFDQEKYDRFVENDYPGYKKFYECFISLKNKIHIDYLNESDLEKLNSTFDSDDGDDSDEFEIDSNDIEYFFNDLLKDF